MKKLIALLLLAAGNALAIDQIELILTVTNHAVTGDSLTINAQTKIWTNAHATDTILTNSATGPAPTATNVAYNLSHYILTSNPAVVQTNTNTIRIVFNTGTSVSASQVGDWCQFTYITNSITKAWTLRVPHTIEANTNQTNFASMIVDYLEHATNRFQAAWEAFTNFPALAGNNLFFGTNRFRQGWWTNATFVNISSASGILGNLTNGVLTNVVLVKPTATNLTVYGGFSSRADGTGSEAIGANASADGATSVAVGSGAVADGANGIAIGASSNAGTNNGCIAIGQSATVFHNPSGNYGGTAIAIGASSRASETNAIAFGYTAISDYTNAIAIGNNVSTTESNQVMIGSSVNKVRVPGRFEPTGTITNAVMTGTNKYGSGSGVFCALAFARYDLTSMAASGNDIAPSNAVYVKVSGAGAAFDLEGIQDGYDGRFLLLQNSESYTWTIENESGGVGAANRIYTGTGANITMTNNPKTIQFIYDSGASRWIVLNHSD